MNKIAAVMVTIACSVMLWAGMGLAAAAPKGDSIKAGVEKTGTGSASGTVRDPDTGLVWLQDANCFGRKSWTEAMEAAGSLKSGDCGLKDGSKASDWRLPTKEELLQRYNNVQPFTNVQTTEIYWTSVPFADDPEFAWSVAMDGGNADFLNKSYNCFVWPVR